PRVDAQRKRPARANEVTREVAVGAAAVVDHASLQPPMMTVGAPGPVIAPVPGGVLLAHGMIESPTRAAGRPPIRTVALPRMIRPSLVAGTAGATPGGVGMWGGTFCRPAPSTAAGLLPISTVVTQPSRMVPI